MVNTVDQCCIFLFLGGSEGTKPHAVEQRLKLSTEVSDIEFFPIKNPSIMNTNKIEFPLEG